MESKCVRIRECPSAKMTICNLPESILCHILSFLPSTKEVVATTILSKQWRYLWTYVDTLRFDNLSEDHPSDGVPGEMQFSQFVNRVLRLLRTPRIKELRLSCRKIGCNEHDITSWITFAILRNVESLSLELSMEYVLPFHYLNSQTLVTLKINVAFVSYANFVKAPCFPGLRIFDLETDFAVTAWLNSIISGCPALECFYLRINKMLNGSTLKISSATLLKIDLECEFDFVKIALDTPGLKSLSIRRGEIREFLVERELSCLSDSVIGYGFISEPSLIQNSDALARFIPSLFNAEILQLHLQCPKPVSCDFDVHFCNLTTLIIESVHHEVKMLKSFMENSNNLKSICLKSACWPRRILDHEIGHEKKIYWVEPERVPTCLLVSLKKMTIEGIIRLDELEVVEYVLNNAKVLEVMKIRSFGCMNENWHFMSQMFRKISMCKKGSERCKIKFQ